MKRLQGKVAIVTGGTRGIGKGIVQLFAKEGAKVAFTYNSSSAAAEELETEFNKEEVVVKGFQSDASDYSMAETFVKSVIELYGTVDILVNNAGITQDTLILRMSEAQWDDVINVNLKSVFNLTKQIMRTMMKARSGSIINMSSVVGVFGNAGQANYAASKAGIIGFTKSIAKEVGSRNIRCNAIAPGFIQTEMTQELDEKTLEVYASSIPARRLGSVDDIARATLFLASDESTYITGQVISVCGGMNI